MHSRTKIRIGTVVAGVFTAVIIVVAHTFPFQSSYTSKTEIKTEQTDSSSEKSTEGCFISVPSSTLPSSSHIDYKQQTFCLIEIMFEDDLQEVVPVDRSVAFSTLFFTLFRAIIAPNAP